VADALRKRLRAEFLKGAEEESQRRLGRPLTPEELERVLLRFPTPLEARPATGAFS
jgi:hypothetical protein